MAELAPALAWLGHSFSAGNHQALPDALALCLKNDLSPMEWMIEAATVSTRNSLPNEGKGRHSNPQRQYQDTLAHTLRYLAVAGCRHAYDADVEQEIAWDGCSQEEAKARVLRRNGKRPSWSRIKENAAELLRGSFAQCTADTAYADYKSVSRDIRANGIDSMYIKGIETHEFVLKHLIGLGGSDKNRPAWYPPPTLG